MKLKADDDRHLAVFFRLYTTHASIQRAGDGGDTFGYAGCLEFRFANPVICPLTSFGDGKWVHLTQGWIMDRIPARSEQTKSLQNPVSAPEHQPEREMLFQLGDGWATCEGTAAQLLAEGIIPEKPEWPDGFRVVSWNAGVLNFSLERVRPAGIKGPRRDFVDCDWWCVRWTSPCIDFAQKEIARKAKELTDAVHRHSERGQTEWNAHWERIHAARKDKQFQAFKARIPALTRSRRGRKAASQEARHD